VTLFVSFLNMRICVSDVTLSVACHRTRARVITIMLEIPWRVTNASTLYLFRCIQQKDNIVLTLPLQVDTNYA